MPEVPDFCGIILAAGESTRMGRDKALLPWPPESASGATFLSAAIKLFFPYVDVVLVVAGKNKSKITPIIYANGASLVINPDPDQGQFSSLQAGLQEVRNRGRDAAMITLVDRPPVRSATIELLQEAFERAIAKRKWAVIPDHNGQHGHPILIANEMLEAFLEAPPTSNARDIMHAHENEIDYVPVDDPSVALNVDTPDQFAALSTSMPSP
jgi:molybdenum cofactor cytidylyltransferase